MKDLARAIVFTLAVFCLAGVAGSVELDRMSVLCGLGHAVIVAAIITATCFGDRILGILKAYGAQKGGYHDKD